MLFWGCLGYTIFTIFLVILMVDAVGVAWTIGFFTLVFIWMVLKDSWK